MRFLTTLFVFIFIFGGSYVLSGSTKRIQLKPLEVDSKKTTTQNIEIWLVQNPVHEHLATVTVDLPMFDKKGEIIPPGYYTLVLTVFSKEQILFEVVLEGNAISEVNRIRYCADLSKQLLTNARIDILETMGYRANLKDFSLLR
jgi:hypothetical protein